MPRYMPSNSWRIFTVSVTLVCLTGCAPRANQMTTGDLTAFATRYAAAWSGKDPVKFASFYDENGSLIVNGAASVGREAITATAGAYMAAFPDMVVRLDSLRQENNVTIFHWTWTGTNTGPGGTGRPVNLHGYERWTIGPNGLIKKSDGHFDNDEYQRQLKGSSSPTP
jgi:SnoaL-like polyketide cyclase.